MRITINPAGIMSDEIYAVYFIYARRVFGRKREEPVGSWKRLHNEELQNFTRNY
jgi:hypothetical protein